MRTETLGEIRDHLAARRMALYLTRRGGQGVVYPFGATIVDRDTNLDVVVGEGHSLREAVLDALDQLARHSDEAKT